MNEEWKLQVSYKTGSGDMVNIRANTADELSVLLEGIGDYSTQIAATNKKIAQAYVVLPFIDYKFHSKHNATSLLTTQPSLGSIRYRSSNL
jgi:hypothetical protein